MELMYEIIYSTEYKQELDEIYYYIKIQLQEENIARRLINRIQKEII